MVNVCLPSKRISRSGGLCQRSLTFELVHQLVHDAACPFGRNAFCIVEVILMVLPVALHYGAARYGVHDLRVLGNNVRRSAFPAVARNAMRKVAMTLAWEDPFPASMNATCVSGDEPMSNMGA